MIVIVKMTDIFNHTILCERCNKKMRRANVIKNGFKMRAVVCEKCGDKIIHPNDVQEYNEFMKLRNKQFRVKLRIVGNSYAVSIPKEIVEFIHEQEKIMNDMVKLCFEEAGKLSLNFNEPEVNDKKKLKKKKIIF